MIPNICNVESVKSINVENIDCAYILCYLLSPYQITNWKFKIKDWNLINRNKTKIFFCPDLSNFNLEFSMRSLIRALAIRTPKLEKRNILVYVYLFLILFFNFDATYLFDTRNLYFLRLWWERTNLYLRSNTMSVRHVF